MPLNQPHSWSTRLRTIYRATRQHALNLAKFVFLYKTFLLLQKKINGGKERSADTFIAGLVGGYIVFGERNAVNEQVRSAYFVYVSIPSPNRSDCIVRLLSRCVLLPRPGEIAILELPHRTGTTAPARSTPVLHLRRDLLGCGYVAVQGARGDNPTRHVQLHDIPVPGFGTLE